MKKTYRLCLLFLFCFGFLSMGKVLPGEDCYRLYAEIMKAYQKFQGDRGYMKFSNYSIVSDVTSEKLVSELWKYDKKVMYKNSLITVYQDAHDQVMILKEGRTIMIRKTDVSPAFVQDYSTFHKDSLDKMTSAVICSRKGKTIAVFSMTMEKKYAQRMGVDKISLEYDRSTQKLLKGTYENLANKQIDIYEYLAFEENIAEPFPGTAVSQIYVQDKKVKPVFANYRIKDLR